MAELPGVISIIDCSNETVPTNPENVTFTVGETENNGIQCAYIFHVPITTAHSLSHTHLNSPTIVIGDVKSLQNRLNVTNVVRVQPNSDVVVNQQLEKVNGTLTTSSDTVAPPTILDVSSVTTTTVTTATSLTPTLKNEAVLDTVMNMNDNNNQVESTNENEEDSKAQRNVTNVEVKVDTVNPNELVVSYILSSETNDYVDVKPITEPCLDVEFKTEPLSDVEPKTEPLSNVELKIEPLSDVEPKTEPLSDVEHKTEPLLDVGPFLEICTSGQESSASVSPMSNLSLTNIKQTSRTYGKPSKKESEKGVEILPGSVTSLDIIPGSVTSLEIIPGSVKSIEVLPHKVVKPTSETKSLHQPAFNYQTAVKIKKTEPIKIPFISRQRKRRIIIDSQKQIPIGEFKQQLSYTKDIVLEKNIMAPPTKKAMKLMEAGGVGKMFCTPGRSLNHLPLYRLFYTRLVIVPETESSSPSVMVPLNSDLRIPCQESISEDAASDEKSGTQATSEFSLLREKVRRNRKTPDSRTAFKAPRVPVFRQYSSLIRKPTVSIQADSDFSDTNNESKTNESIDEPECDHVKPKKDLELHKPETELVTIKEEIDGGEISTEVRDIAEAEAKIEEDLSDKTDELVT